MPTAPNTAVCAALLACLYSVLSLRVVYRRCRLRAPLGPTDDERLQRAIRVHGNFAEYVPLALLLMLLLEVNGLGAGGLQAYGGVLVAARLAHAWGVSRPAEWLGWRMAATALTLGLIGAAATALLLQAWPALPWAR